jgi:nitroreductase
MTVMEAIEARWSVRSYADRPVEPEKLAQIMEAGRLAPTASNEQKWKHIAVTDPELIKKMLLYALDLYDEGASLKEKVKASYTADEIGEVAKEFTETFFDDSLVLFLMKHMEYASNGSV